MPYKDKIISALDNNLFNALGEAVLLIDKEYNVIYANASFKTAFGQKAQGGKCYQHIGKNSPCQICTCSLSSKKQQSQEKEERINGSCYLVSSKIIPMRPSVNSFYIETYKDITYSRDLERSLLAKNTLLKNNLDIAKQVQLSLLPQPDVIKGVKLTYKYIPCEDLGGDFFNLYRIDENKMGFFMADISGHGVSAAMLTMFLNSSYDKTADSPAEILSGIFRLFNENNFLKNQYIAVFYVVFDIRDMSLRYCNAGLNSYPVLFNSDTGRIRLLEASGFPISNWVDSPGYADKTICVEPGERILFYTDGITDAKNKYGDPYGTERLLKSLTEGNPNTNLILSRLISYLEDYTDVNVSKLRDDVTLVIIEPDN